MFKSKGILNSRLEHGDVESCKGPVVVKENKLLFRYKRKKKTQGTSLLEVFSIQSHRNHILFKLPEHSIIK